jgi:hypothetical protein
MSVFAGSVHDDVDELIDSPKQVCAAGPASLDGDVVRAEWLEQRPHFRLFHPGPQSADGVADVRVAPERPMTGREEDDAGRQEDQKKPARSSR